MNSYKIEDGITCSMLLTWLSCRMAGHYYIHGWTAVKRMDAAEFGSCWHALMRRLYDKLEYTPKLKIDDLVEQGVQVGNEFFNLWYAEKSRLLGDPDALQKLEDDISTARGLLPGYLLRWPKDFQNKIKYDLETEFSIDFEGFHLRGKRDAVFQDSKKKLWLLETKTKSRIDDVDNLVALSFDFQTMFYMLATQTEMKKRVAGCVYNVVRKPQIRQKQNESPKQFSQRLIEDVATRPEFYFIRYEIVHPPQEQDEFRADLLERLHEFAKWVAGERPTFRSESACLGRWTCRFIHACSSGCMEGYMQRPLFSELDGA